MKALARVVLFLGTAAAVAASGCAPSAIRPADLHPEDACANCRMAISDKSFASQIIEESGDAMKFDDLSCLEQYRKKNVTLKIAAMFVADYETKEWLAYEKSIIVETGIDTPMGSGKIAVKNEARAKEISGKFPATKNLSKAGCCEAE